MQHWRVTCTFTGMRLKLILVGFFALHLAVSAQEVIRTSGPSDDPVEHTLSVRVDRVNVVFTVAGKDGRLITNLNKDDFQVFEDGESQTISNFSKEANLPLSIGLLVDTSGSIWGKLRFEREAASNFFYSILRPGKDTAFVMTFDSRVALAQDYTDNPAVLQHAVDHLIAGGSTSLFDAIAAAAGHMLSGQAGRKVLIVLSDGLDNSSHIGLAKALESAQKNDVVVYTISTNRIDGLMLQDPAIGDRNLRQLALETGGHALFPRTIGDLSHSFYKIGQDLRAQYSLAYGPTNARRDGTYRTIHIVPMHHNFSVRCRHGYFAPR